MATNNGERSAPQRGSGVPVTSRVRRVAVAGCVSQPDRELAESASYRYLPVIWLYAQARQAEGI